MTIHGWGDFRVPLFGGDDNPRTMYLNGKYVFPSQYVFGSVYTVSCPISFKGQYDLYETPEMYHEYGSNGWTTVVNSKSESDYETSGASNIKHIIHKGDGWYAILTNEAAVVTSGSKYRSYFLHRESMTDDPSRTLLSGTCSWGDYKYCNKETGETIGDSIYIKDFGNNGQRTYGVTSAHFNMWCTYEVRKNKGFTLNPRIDKVNLKFVNDAIPTDKQIQVKDVYTYPLKYVESISGTSLHAQKYLAKASIDYMPYSSLAPLDDVDRISPGGSASNWWWHFTTPSSTDSDERIYVTGLGFEAHVG